MEKIPLTDVSIELLAEMRERVWLYTASIFGVDGSTPHYTGTATCVAVGQAELIGPWLDIPPRRKPGDANMPRVQGPSFVAALRLAVSAGREEAGFFHMPGGQSGHPLSPFYRKGHEALEEGKPTPFLQGPAVHRLRLEPTD